VTVNTLSLLQKLSISNKCCPFEISIQQKNHRKRCITVPQKIFLFCCDKNDFRMIAAENPGIT